MTLTADYNFSDGAGGTVTDQSGNSRDLTVLNGQWVTGHTGGGLQGSASPGQSGAVVSYTMPTAALTIMGWVRPLQSTNTVWAFGFHDNNASTMFAVWAPRTNFGPSGLQANVRTTNGFNAISIGSPDLDNWQHIAVTYDSTDIVIYLNGVEFDRVNDPGGLSLGGSHFMVAGWSDSAALQAVVVDDVRIFDTALSEAQIATEMNTAGEGGGSTNYVRSAGSMQLGLSLNSPVRQMNALRSAQLLQFGMSLGSPSKLTGYVRSASTLPFGLSFGQPHHSELNMEPELLGDGSLADRIFSSLTAQGFTEGSITDRERARLLAKLAITGENLSLHDLYVLAGEPFRLHGVYGAPLP